MLRMLLRFVFHGLGILKPCLFQKQEKVYEKPIYGTKASYEANVKFNRASRTADADTGYKPTTSQKWLLVITGLYNNRAEIPEYVP